MKKFFLGILLGFGMFLGIFFKIFHTHIFTKQVSVCNETGYEIEFFSISKVGNIRNFKDKKCINIKSPKFSKNLEISYTIIIENGENKKIYQGQELFPNKNSLSLTHITFDNQNSLGNFFFKLNRK